MLKETRKANGHLYYTEGSTVRKVAVPVRQPEIKKLPQQKEVRRDIRRENRRRHRRAAELNLSLPYVLFLFAMVVMVVVSCVRYLELNAQVSETKEAISALQTELDTLVTKNDAIDYDINGYIDVEYIIKTATQQLGMVVPGSGQVEFYDSTTSEFMNQLNDVPEE